MARDSSPDSLTAVTAGSTKRASVASSVTSNSSGPEIYTPPSTPGAYTQAEGCGCPIHHGSDQPTLTSLGHRESMRYYEIQRPKNGSKHLHYSIFGSDEGFYYAGIQKRPFMLSYQLARDLDFAKRTFPERMGAQMGLEQTGTAVNVGNMRNRAYPSGHLEGPALFCAHHPHNEALQYLFNAQYMGGAQLLSNIAWDDQMND